MPESKCFFSALLCFFSALLCCILTGTPEAINASMESRQTAAPLMQLHRNLTSPPSLWPGRELRKYHCPSALVVAYPGTARSLLQWLYRSAFRVMARLQPGLEAPHLTAQGMYLSGCVFSCQGSIGSIPLCYWELFEGNRFKNFCCFS